MLGFDDVGQLVLIHFENDVFQFLRKLTALVLTQVTALLGGRAIGKTFGQFGEILAFLHAIQQLLRLRF